MEPSNRANPYANLGNSEIDNNLINDLMRLINGPKNLDNLDEDVDLDPCHHKIHSHALKKLQEQKNETCPECHLKITGFTAKSQETNIDNLLTQISAPFKAEYRKQIDPNQTFASELKKPEN